MQGTCPFLRPSRESRLARHRDPPLCNHHLFYSPLSSPCSSIRDAGRHPLRPCQLFYAIRGSPTDDRPSLFLPFTGSDFSPCLTASAIIPVTPHYMSPPITVSTRLVFLSGAATHRKTAKSFSVQTAVRKWSDYLRRRFWLT